jgi:hypothetical protein
VGRLFVHSTTPLSLKIWRTRRSGRCSDYNGYTVVTKVAKEHFANGRRKIKGQHGY